MTVKLALTYDEAAEAVGYSRSVIERAVKANRLLATYATVKPVIQVDELKRWLDSLPTERPVKANR